MIKSRLWNVCFCLLLMNSCSATTNLKKKYICRSKTAVKIDADTGKIWPYEMPTRYTFLVSENKIFQNDDFNSFTRGAPRQILEINNIEIYPKKQTTYIQARSLEKKYHYDTYNHSFVITDNYFVYTDVTRVYTMVITGTCSEN